MRGVLKSLFWVTLAFIIIDSLILLIFFVNEDFDCWHYRNFCSNSFNFTFYLLLFNILIRLLFRFIYKKGIFSNINKRIWFRLLMFFIYVLCFILLIMLLFSIASYSVKLFG